MRIAKLVIDLVPVVCVHEIVTFSPSKSFSVKDLCGMPGSMGAAMGSSDTGCIGTRVHGSFS